MEFSLIPPPLNPMLGRRANFWKLKNPKKMSEGIHLKTIYKKIEVNLSILKAPKFGRTDSDRRTDT